MALRSRSSNVVAQAFVVRAVVTRVYARAHLIGWVATNVRRSPGILSRYVERALNLLRANGRFGMIVPIASVSTNGMAELQTLYKHFIQWHSHFAVRPGKLFVGVDMNLTISLLQKTRMAQQNFTTGYRR